MQVGKTEKAKEKEPEVVPPMAGKLAGRTIKAFTPKIESASQGVQSLPIQLEVEATKIVDYVLKAKKMAPPEEAKARPRSYSLEQHGRKNAYADLGQLAEKAGVRLRSASAPVFATTQLIPEKIQKSEHIMTELVSTEKSYAGSMDRMVGMLKGLQQAYPKNKKLAMYIKSFEKAQHSSNSMMEKLSTIQQIQDPQLRIKSLSNLYVSPEFKSYTADIKECVVLTDKVNDFGKSVDKAIKKAPESKLSNTCRQINKELKITGDFFRAFEGANITPAQRLPRHEMLFQEMSGCVKKESPLGNQIGGDFAKFKADLGVYNASLPKPKAK